MHVISMQNGNYFPHFFPITSEKSPISGNLMPPCISTTFQITDSDESVHIYTLKSESDWDS